jgi:hypothetical protein
MASGCSQDTNCGAGTRRDGDQCVPTDKPVTCGDGTKLVDGGCVAASPLICGTGTVEQYGQCVPTSGLSCGSGTVEKNGACVPSSSLVCATGTTEKNGACVPNDVCGTGTIDQSGQCVPANPLTCGPGTVADAGNCVPATPASAACGAGTVLVDDHCEAADIVWVWAPFPSGFASRIYQGANGNETHFGADAESVDFTVPEGTNVAAARSGLVIETREDSNTGCGDATCADQANYIVIDHGNGTRGRYYHLQQNGVLVNVGDVVCSGQLIGKSGNTGYSGGPHLHFDVVNPFGYTVPVRFNELSAATGGVAVTYDTLTSMNASTTCPSAGTPSDCPADTFATRGILLDPGAPCAYAKRGKAYTISGRITGQGKGALVLLHSTTLDWVHQCATVGSDGHFSTKVTWDAASFPGESALHVTETTDAACTTYPGWYSSAHVTLVD